jgi:hypothetical protein
MRRAVVAVCGVLLIGCSDDGGAASTSDTGVTSSVVTSSTVAGATDDSVVGRYVAALDAGDVATANSLRCDKGKVPDTLLQQFTAEAASVRGAAGGSLAIEEATLVDPVTLGSLYGERPDSQVAFSLATPSGPTSLVALAVITENGQQRVCGEMQEGSPGVQSAVQSATITPSASTIVDLSTALPAELVPGATQVDDSAVTDLAAVPGALAGWTRAWSIPGGGVRVTLLRTDGPDAAMTLAKQALGSPGLDSAEQLADLANGFQGVSAVTLPWTWVHPASLGARTDTAVGVADDVTLVVEVTGVEAGKGHDTVHQAVAALQFA